MAFNYANNLLSLQRFEDAKAVLRKMTPVAQRVLGEANLITLKMRRIYADALVSDESATLDDLREATKSLEDAVRIARRVLGGAHPLAVRMKESLQNVRAALRAGETPSARTA